MIVLESLSCDEHTDPGGASTTLLALKGRQLDGRPVVWTIAASGLRSLSFVNRIVSVPRARIERFLIAYQGEAVYTLLARGTFALPTRLWQPGQRRRGSGAQYPPQNMELGTVFGTVSRQELAGQLRALGYEVVECPWESLMPAGSQA